MRSLGREILAALGLLGLAFSLISLILLINPNHKVISYIKISTIWLAAIKTLSLIYDMVYLRGLDYPIVKKPFYEKVSLLLYFFCTLGIVLALVLNVFLKGKENFQEDSSSVSASNSKKV